MGKQRLETTLPSDSGGGSIIIKEIRNGEPNVRWFTAHSAQGLGLAFLLQPNIPDACAENCIFIEGGGLPISIKRLILDTIQYQCYEEDYPNQ